jgi:hypothetical protein
MMLRACAWLAFVSTGGLAAEGVLPGPVLVGQMPAVVTESSGLVKSRRYADKGVFWTHNDSGDTARIFAVDAGGKLLREVVLPNAKNVDWEEIAADEQGRLIVADIGDNLGKRENITLYRLAEPDAFNADERVAAPHVFRVRYPADQKPCDAEALFVRAGSAYLFTKEPGCVRCYRLPLPETPPANDTVAEAMRVAESKTFGAVTGAALSFDGRRVALINYLTIMVVELPKPFDEVPDAPEQIFTAPRRVRNTWLGQTEAVAWHGDDLVLTTEGGAIYRVNGAAGAK